MYTFTTYAVNVTLPKTAPSTVTSGLGQIIVISDEQRLHTGTNMFPFFCHALLFPFLMSMETQDKRTFDHHFYTNKSLQKC